MEMEYPVNNPSAKIIESNADLQKAYPIFGDKLYQQKARAALPLLIRQAEAGYPITFEALAAELGMRMALNLNKVLGAIGQTIKLVSSKWGQEIPAITCIVFNKKKRLPSDGVQWFLSSEEFETFHQLPKALQHIRVDKELKNIYSYPHWHKVLRDLEIAPWVPTSAEKAAIAQAAFQGYGTGEGELHRTFKEFIAQNPQLLGLRSATLCGIEYGLPSGDRVDVMFKDDSEWVAVEGKGIQSNEADITRGIFQCVKYRAVQQAVIAYHGTPESARSILVLEGKLPASLISLKNTLGVEVIEDARSLMAQRDEKADASSPDHFQSDLSP